MIATMSPARPRQSRAWIGVAVILVALATLPYLQTLRHDFVYDDYFYVVGNPYVQQGLTWLGIVWAFTTSRGGNWHPVTWLSHMFDVSVWGSEPAAHHFTNVVLHAANTVLLFLIFWQMTGGLWRSGLLAALFAVHPLHVESVAWIAERKDVLSTFFGLLAIWAYIKYVRDSSRGQYLLMLCLFALALMTKPMLVSLPCILLLLDIWPLGRWKPLGIDDRTTATFTPQATSRLLLEKVPLVVLSAIFSIVALISQHRAQNIIPGGELLPLSNRVGNALVGYHFYLEKLFAPIKLAVFYPYPGYWRPTVVAVSIFLLLVITLVAILYRRRHPWLIVGWLWFIITLIPVIGLIQVGMQSIADRYTYIPSIGIFMMLVWSIPTTHKSLALRAWTVAACAVIVILTVMTWIQTSYWKDRRTLFTHAAEVTEGNYIAHQSLGVALETEEHDLDGALKLYRTAAQEQPGFARTAIHENIANILMQQGHTEEAFAEARHALEIDPRSTTALNSMGSLLLTTGNNQEAVKYFLRAAQLDPEYLEAQINCGVTLVKLERWNEAIEHLAPVARLAPRRYLARTCLARALAARGDYDQAIDQVRQILKLKPDHVVAQELLREIQLEQKQHPGASPNQDNTGNQP
jgi:Tfp pilus assembly protein PilF